MIGELPKSLTVGGVEYPIETDFRNILVFFSACNDPELGSAQKMEILLRRLYRDGYDKIPQENLEEAMEQAKWFVDCGREQDERRPPRKLMDWEQDEAIVFPAINKVASCETRSVPYIHWWTFAGYFMEIQEGTFSTVLGIRQKKSQGKRLDKWEMEFYRNNKKICDLKKRYTEEEQEEIDEWKRLLRKTR